jgi:hypothetical protein
LGRKLRKSEVRKLQREIEKQRELLRNPIEKEDQMRPSVVRLFFMVLWAKITGAGS